MVDAGVQARPGCSRQMVSVRSRRRGVVDCGRISGSRCRSYGCSRSPPTRDHRPGTATTPSTRIPHRACPRRYLGCASGEARPRARGAARRAIAPWARVADRAPAGAGGRTPDTHPPTSARTPEHAIRVRTTTTPAGLTARPAFPGRAPGCAWDEARPAATAPGGPANGPARRCSARRRGGPASTPGNQFPRHGWPPPPPNHDRAAECSRRRADRAPVARQSDRRTSV